MFTRMSKVLLWIMVVAIVIGAFIVDEEVGAEACLLVLIGGLLLVMMFGLFVELCNNVLDIKKKMYYIDFSSINNSHPQTLSASSSKLERAAAQVAHTEETPVGWYCRACGEKNKYRAAVCVGCGKSK